MQTNNVKQDNKAVILLLFIGNPLLKGCFRSSFITWISQSKYHTDYGQGKETNREYFVNTFVPESLRATLWVIPALAESHSQLALRPTQVSRAADYNPTSWVVKLKFATSSESGTEQATVIVLNIGDQ
jgi:hypothetical protein